MTRARRDTVHDWTGADFTRPYPKPTRRRETFARLAFGCAGALFLGGMFLYALHKHEIAAALAVWHH